MKLILNKTIRSRIKTNFEPRTRSTKRTDQNKPWTGDMFPALIHTPAAGSCCCEKFKTSAECISADNEKRRACWNLYILESLQENILKWNKWVPIYMYSYLWKSKYISVHTYMNVCMNVPIYPCILTYERSVYIYL